MRQHLSLGMLVLLVAVTLGAGTALAQMDGQVRAVTADSHFKVSYFPTRRGIGARDVAPAPDGTVWFAGQFSGTVGHLDPKTGHFSLYPLGPRSSPHGINWGPDGNVWVVDGGQNALVRVHPADHKMTYFRIPKPYEDLNLNTGVFDHAGMFWFTGDNGYYGRLDPASGKIEIWDAPRGMGPYGITVTPQGTIWFTSFACNYIAAVDSKTGEILEVADIPDPLATGSRRIWSDSQGRLWMATWGTGEIFRYDPRDKSWAAYKLPGLGPRGYSMFVDDKDYVWVSEFMANSILRFDPRTESYVAFPSNKFPAQVLQMTGNSHAVWGGEQGQDRLVLIESK